MKSSKGDKYKILAFSIQNLTFSYREVEQHKKEIDFDKRVESLFTNLRLPEKPLHIECFDNSNIQGTNPVAACVVFRNGAPSKEEYRHYNVKSVSGPDDFASMREIVFRRYERQINERKSLPNLIVIDGGKGQLSAALEALDSRLRQQLLGLGASNLQMVWYLWREARLPLLAALMAGFGAVISEVGASMMVGGNIRYQTRVLTTAIVLETGKGHFEIAIALGLLLLLITFLVNWALTWIQQRGARQ